MPAADDRANTVTNVVSARYGSVELQAFQRAMPASDHVAVPAPSGAAPARATAMRLLIATVASAARRPQNARTASVMIFARRYGHRPTPCVSTDRSVPAP